MACEVGKFVDSLQVPQGFRVCLLYMSRSTRVRILESSSE